MNLFDFTKKVFSTLLLSMLCVVAFAQGKTVAGVVLDEFGDPMIGVNVAVKGTTTGAVTDFDGNYVLHGVKSTDVLSFTFIGYTTKEEKIGDRAKIDVTMTEDNQALEEVVVIGYGTVSKKDLTGAVASIKAKDIAAVPVSSASEALTGKMAGVSVTTTEGSPDADVKIRVRGGGSLSQDNSPLYIVDGFEVSSISDIAPSEIESMDVLKDASSTAIYGARGANGVIIVTTKSGKEGKVQVNVNASYGLKQVTKMQKVLSPYEYAYYQYELESKSQNFGYTTSYGSFQDLDIWRSVKGTDFQDEIFCNTGSQTQYNANISGGTKDLKYNISYAHNEEESIMKKSGYNKDNINTKINGNINKWLSVDFQARLAYQNIDGLSGGNDTNESNAATSVVARAVRFRPISPLSADDEDDETSTSTQYSPLERLMDTYKQQQRQRQDYNFRLKWKPFKGWTFQSELGYYWRYNKADQVWGTKASQALKSYASAPQAYFLRDDYKGWSNSNTVTYDNKSLFGKRDQINVLIGQEWKSTRETERTSQSVYFDNSMTLKEILHYTSTGTAIPNTADYAADENLLSFFGRVNYTMMQKYLLTVTMRADGSSKFGSDNRWGFFPSAALAWRISDEAWMEKSEDWLSNLKVRLSFGTAGNNRINSGLMTTTYSLGQVTGRNVAYFGDGTPASMLVHGTYLANPDLKWETTVTRNFGIDYGFFNGRVSGSLDFYWNTTKDLLMAVDVPTSTGYSQQYRNFGQTSNKGVELQLQTVIVDKKNFNLNFTFNAAYNKNHIDDLDYDNPWQTSNFAGSMINYGSGDFRVKEGGQLGEVWGYKNNGFYTIYNPTTGEGDLVYTAAGWALAPGVVDNSSSLSSLMPGAPKYQLDENGDPKLQKLGNTIAPVTGGFGFDGRYKWFDFSVFFNYSLGGDIVNGTKLASSFYAGSQNGYNLVNDSRLAKRFSYVDPATGANLAYPHANVVASLGGYDAATGYALGLMERLSDINQGKSQYAPQSVTKAVISSDAVEDASFLRLQNITVGYTMPKNLTRKWLIEQVRFYVTGYNLVCFTGYSGTDPEVDTSSKKNPMTPGIDYAAYPKSRSYVAGLNITF